VIVRPVSHSVDSVTGRPTTGPPSDVLTVPTRVPVCAAADWVTAAARTARTIPIERMGVGGEVERFYRAHAHRFRVSAGSTTGQAIRRPTTTMPTAHDLTHLRPFHAPDNYLDILTVFT
jgi:hypothetical protein